MAASIKSLVPDDASTRIEDLEYLYASIANVSNFVSVKLSGNNNYHLWKTQMLCLMETHCMRSLVDDAFVDGPRPSASSKRTKKQYDSLLKGWIFGSISEGVLGTVANLGSAKDVWSRLEHIYVPSMSSRHVVFMEDQTLKYVEKEETVPQHNDDLTDLDPVPPKHVETRDGYNVHNDEQDGPDDADVPKQIEMDAEAHLELPVSGNTHVSGVSELSLKGATRLIPVDLRDKLKELCKFTMQGCWKEVEGILKEGNNLEKEPLNGEGNTVLHIAVGIGHYYFIEALLQFIVKKEASEKTSKPNIEKKEASEKTSKPSIGKKKASEKTSKPNIRKKEASEKTSKPDSALQMRNSNGSTALHVAAIVGHKDAAELLVNADKELLTIKDNDGRLPLFKAYSKMQFDTFIYLWDQATMDDDRNQVSNFTMGVELLVNAISANEYGIALEIVKKFPRFAMENDRALMAIARNFPNGLDYWETFICPCSLSDTGKRIQDKLGLVFVLLSLCCRPRYFLSDTDDDSEVPLRLLLLYAPFIILLWVYCLLSFLIYMVYLPFYFVYFLWWEVATRLGVPPVKDIMKKKKECDEAKKLLEWVCNTIDSKFSGTQNPIYDKPILEAARQNAYQVVDEILYRSPDVIQSTDENGYDIIQLAVIHRSDKIYNLIYQIGEPKSRYGTWKDSSDNNILHLVGRLAPSHELNSRTGAALQLQRELQWREELKTFVFPAYVTQENIFKETPAMVFTREHKDLVKEGEKWMKATAESCSITAGLITTIVFAAAITVPGGNNQETGIPLFRNDIAFIIFAASDAISLFTSSTALLVFLSILTARFAEQDFLISLPRRLIIGFCALLLSTTAMMVSFSAILYLVFCDQKSWTIGLICGLAFIPIACFVALQFSLIVDLHRSTYVRIFGQQTNWRPSRFDPRHVQAYFK